MQGGDLQRLRRLNALSSINALRTAGQPLTLSELATATGLSRGSIGDVVGELQTRGWVAEVEPAPGAMGRPARRYRFRADVGHVLGVDIGVNKVLATVTDLDGHALASGRTAVGAGTDTATRLAAVTRATEAALYAAGLTQSAIWAVTAGTFGVVDRKGAVARVEAVPSWTGVDLVGHLCAAFTCPVLVENDSKLAALAEQRLGVASGVRDLVYLLAGRRPGAALIVNGALHHGFSGYTGEVGLLDVTGWRTMSERLERLGVASGAHPEDAAAQVFAAARNGEAAARAAIEEYAADLALGTAAMVLTLDPELVVLGGGFSRSGDVLLEPLRRALEPHCLRVPDIRLSNLGEECVVLGAACLAIDHLNGRFFSPDHEIAPPRAPLR
ncbi:MAG: ROK family protein [Nonomuraea sp.]|nr:ROK family protein [Nonomuraea sp.]